MSHMGRCQKAWLARVTKCALLTAAPCLGLAGVSSVHAIGLDEIAQQSGLGEPLRLVIPVLANSADELTGNDFAGECFKVVPAAASDLPQLNSARLTLERRDGRAFVVLTTAYPIDEPVMRVAVRAGCRASISREYTVLFDPVPISPPEVAAASPAASPSTPVPASAAMETPRASVGASPPDARRAHRPPTSPKRAAVARTKSANGPTQAVRRAASAAPTPRVEKASAGPRLQVSRTIGDGATAPVASAARTAAAEREALHAIEEQTVVLQRQIAELSLAMERVQEELRAARAARAEAEKAARAATERAAAAAPRSMVSAWALENWLLLVLLPVLAVLVAALLVQRRRERPRIPHPFTAAQAEAFNLADLGEPSLPSPGAADDEEAVVASIKETYRKHLNRSVAAGSVEPGEPETTEREHDPGMSFDDEVQKSAEESSALEREQPGIVVRLMKSWGTPGAAKLLETYLLTPRPSAKALSRSAIEELKLLRSIAEG